jgi:hypothetical protein
LHCGPGSDDIKVWLGRMAGVTNWFIEFFDMVVDELYMLGAKGQCQRDYGYQILNSTFGVSH